MNDAGLQRLKDLTVCFAHPAYALGDEFAARNSGIDWIEVRTAEDLVGCLDTVDVLVISGLWRNEYLVRASRLRFVQSVSSGTDQFDLLAFRSRGVRLASAAGVNCRAVAEHAMSLMLSFSRRLYASRDNQNKSIWDAGPVGRSNRPFELAGRTVIVIGLGRVGITFASLARCFGMRVIGVNRTPRTEPGIHKAGALDDMDVWLQEADFVVVTCALCEETKGLIGAEQFARMKRSACLINVARGGIVCEDALISALRSGQIRGAALDCFDTEPLDPTSALWRLPNLIITPHLAGETPTYEKRLVDILQENLLRLKRQTGPLLNELA